MALLIIILAWCTLLVPCTAHAEDAADAVRALLPWARNIQGSADEWVYRAETLGYKVNHKPCENCVLVFPPSYGQGVNTSYGHVAVLRAKHPGKGYLIQDSNGFGGCDRCTKWVRKIDFRKVSVIHPPKKRGPNKF